jgi:signal transduction histidine kinase
VEPAFEAQPGLPPFFTDEAKLSQILRNFVSNALKFTERGTVRVSARVEGEGRMVFSVAGTGIGIAPGQTEKIFGAFWQAEQAPTRRVGGTGLGLSVTRRLARMLGGDVEVTSVPGQGSTFTVTIPLRMRAP